MEKIDLATQNVINQVEGFRQNSYRLQLEAFKIDTIMNMMNNCSAKCNLQYRESGIKDQSHEDVACFTSCLSKSNNLSKMISQ